MYTEKSCKNIDESCPLNSILKNQNSMVLSTNRPKRCKQRVKHSRWSVCFVKGSFFRTEYGQLGDVLEQIQVMVNYYELLLLLLLLFSLLLLSFLFIVLLLLLLLSLLLKLLKYMFMIMFVLITFLLLLCC